MQYDEIRITTWREIQICEAAIRSLLKNIAVLEGKKSGPGRFSSCQENLLEDNRQALARWQERLHSHQQIMKL